jgi:hypothetical protein
VDYAKSEGLSYRYWVQEYSTVQVISSKHFVYAEFWLVEEQKKYDLYQSHYISVSFEELLVNYIVPLFLLEVSVP